MLVNALVIDLLSSCAAQRHRLRQQIIRYQNDFAEYKAVLEDLENKQPLVVDFDTMGQAAIMGDRLQELEADIYSQQRVQSSLAEKFDRVLPWVITDMIRRGNKIRISRGQGEGSYLIWLSDDIVSPEHMVEGLAYGQDPNEVINDPERNKTVADLIKERFGSKG